MREGAVFLLEISLCLGMRKNILTILVAILLSSNAWAALSPLALSIVPPLQYPASDYSITGARVSALWGRHRDIYGIDIGLLGNITEQDFVGIGVSGLFNATYGTTTVWFLQAALGMNYNKQKTNVYGVQVAAVNINEAASAIGGLQLALTNIGDHTTIYGAQVGIYNRALTVNGFQIGIINVTETLRGIQIGLLNFQSKGLFKVSPIINIGF